MNHDNPVAISVPLAGYSGICRGIEMMPKGRDGADCGAGGDDEPVWKGGIRPLIGYARISTAEGARVLDRQFDALHAGGCEQVFEGRASAVKADRPGLAACLDLPRGAATCW